MINKIYDEIKKYIKENYKGLIFLILFACFCFYNTGYSIYKPGGIINASQRVNGIKLYKSKGTLNMAYVGYIEGNLPFYLLAKVLPDWELVKNDKVTYSENETMEDAATRDHLYFKEAINSATLVALNKAKKEYTIKNTHFYLIYKTDESNNELKIGDEILSYDNNEFTSVENFIKYINTKNKGDIIEIKYQTDDKSKETTAKVYEEDGKLYLGLSIIKMYDIKSNYNITINSKSSESGPSGGLITALSIYNSLVKEDITKGNKIVGTGTIDEEGIVGEIGSVNYKLASAVKENADIFICPVGNYDEAVKYAKKKNYDIIIKKASTFDDALNILNNMEEK